MENVKKNSGQYIMIGENRIRYFEEGEGDTVLFIHGIGQAMSVKTYTHFPNTATLLRLTLSVTDFPISPNATT